MGIFSRPKWLLKFGKQAVEAGITPQQALRDLTNREFVVPLWRLANKESNKIGTDLIEPLFKRAMQSGILDNATLQKSFNEKFGRRTITLSDNRESLVRSLDAFYDEQFQRIRSNLSGNTVEALHPGNPNKKFKEFGSAWRGLSKFATSDEAGKIIGATEDIFRQMDVFRKNYSGMVGSNIIADWAIPLMRQTGAFSNELLEVELKKLEALKTITQSGNEKVVELFKLATNKRINAHANAPYIQALRLRARESLEAAESAMKVADSGFNSNRNISLNRNKISTKSRNIPSY